MNLRTRQRLAAILALIVMAFSTVETAFATQCAHENAVAVQVSHAGHSAETDEANSPEDSSKCDHNASISCAQVSHLIPVRSFVIDRPQELRLIAPSPAAIVDRITSHAAFHPPRN